MKLKHIFQTAWGGLRRNAARSLLTILGIVIGITAIILVVAVGSGARELILAQIQGLGTRTMVVIPGREPSGPSDFAQTLLSDSLKERDLAALGRRSNAPSVSALMPLVFGAETAVYRGETYRPTIFGGTELIVELFDVYPAAGVFITGDDVRGRVEVAVIGSKVKAELFGAGEAIGEKIKIKGRNFRVIGILPEKGQVSFFNFDETVIVPYSTAQQYIFGIKHFHRIIAQAESEAAIPAAVSDLTATLRSAHGITDPAKDDFFIETQTDIAERLGVITNVLTLFLASVAAISLIVGGIGIMNIMLVSVTERTREIGLRKALGATEGDIMAQFLLEAILLTVSGGAAGVLLGAGLSVVATLILARVVGLDWSFTFPASAALLGIGVATAIGLAFGIYPARKASQKSPIEALRYE